MLPIRDHQRASKTPILTYLIIVVNILVFLIELASPDDFIFQYALIPVLVNFGSLQTLTPFITSQFLHAGFLHIISNMWFLNIFGDNVEERFGKLLYLPIYLISGVVGAVSQYLLSPGSDIPMLGASGAVAGVLGAYLVFFPRHTVETLIPFGFFSQIVNLPASVILIYWFVIQFFSGVGSIAVAQVGGVAWFAHIGGFATGWLIAKVFPNKVGDVEKGEILDI